jgi:hypothetical protein
MARIAHTAPIHLGLDVHRNTISVATLLPDRAFAAVEQIPSDEAAVLAFLGRFAEPGRLRVCYEAARPATSWPGCCTPGGSPAR